MIKNIKTIFFAISLFWQIHLVAKNLYFYNDTNYVIKVGFEMIRPHDVFGLDRTYFEDFIYIEQDLGLYSYNPKIRIDIQEVLTNDSDKNSIISIYNHFSELKYKLIESSIFAQTENYTISKNNSDLLKDALNKYLRIEYVCLPIGKYRELLTLSEQMALSICVYKSIEVDCLLLLYDIKYAITPEEKVKYNRLLLIEIISILINRLNAINKNNILAFYIKSAQILKDKLEQSF